VDFSACFLDPSCLTESELYYCGLSHGPDYTMLVMIIATKKSNVINVMNVERTIARNITKLANYLSS
jgi:hypothetical protein